MKLTAIFQGDVIKFILHWRSIHMKYLYHECVNDYDMQSYMYFKQKLLKLFII